MTAQCPVRRWSWALAFLQPSATRGAVGAVETCPQSEPPRTSRTARLVQRGIVEQLADTDAEGIRHPHQRAQCDEMRAGLYPAERDHIDAQFVGCFLLGPAARPSQFDHPPANVSHHVVGALHASNVPWLDAMETEDKYTRLGLSDTVSNAAPGRPG